MTKEEAIICKVYLNDLDKYHTCNEYKLLMQLIDQEPVLDKIRNEIKKEIDRDDHADEYCDGYYDGMRKALAIIDKYKAESENNE